MDSLITVLLFGLAALVLFVSSFLAKTLKAKRYKFYWIIITWALAFVAIIASNIYQLDGLYALAIGIATFIISLLIVNGMKIATAATTAIASFAVMGLGFVGVLYAMNESGMETGEITTTVLSFVPESKYYDATVLKKSEKVDVDLLEEEDVLSYSDSDLLPNRVVHEPVIKSKVYQEINPRKAGSMKGAVIRLLKTDGKTVKGNVVGMQGNKLIVGKYIPGKGVIKAPISLSSIEKLEVIK